MHSPDILAVNFGHMMGAVSDIDRAVATLNQKLGELDRKGQELKATWSGDAQAAYNLRQAQWTRAANDLIEILGRIKMAVDHSAADYQHTEQMATRRFE